MMEALNERVVDLEDVFRQQMLLSSCIMHLATHCLDSKIIGADGGTRTRTMLPSQDFKSCVSTGSTTSATWAFMRCAALRCNGLCALSPIFGRHRHLSVTSA